MISFMGYRREGSRAGTRNYVAVISTVDCANHVVNRIVAQSENAIAVTHENGCMQFGRDRDQTYRVLYNMGIHPNAGAALYVGLGCEEVNTPGLAASVAGRPARHIIIQEEKGSTQSIRRGVEIVKELNREIASQKRIELPLSELGLGVKCGGSDYTGSLFSNPALGLAADRVIALGGAAVLTETPGYPGAEHILAKRARTPEIAEKIWKIVNEYRTEIWERFKEPLNECNPTPGNIQGGITTLAEKSIGNIKKGGSTPVEGVLEFGERFDGRKGLYVMDTPGHDIYSVAGAAAGGAQVVAFTTGRGNPMGSALTSVIKISASEMASKVMPESIDVDISDILWGKITLQEAGDIIFRKIVAVASGELTACEILGHAEFAIPKIGSAI